MATFNWIDKYQATLDELRRHLTSTPMLMLAYPDFAGSFILGTDTSNTGIGAVLSQVDDVGREHVVMYGTAPRAKAVPLVPDWSVVPADGPWVSDLAAELPRAKRSAGTLASVPAAAGLRDRPPAG